MTSREQSQFENLIKFVDQRRPSIPKKEGQRRNIDLLTIQRLLEKDMVKKMPIKLKAQLRVTQQIADVMVSSKSPVITKEVEVVVEEASPSLGKLRTLIQN